VGNGGASARRETVAGVVKEVAMDEFAFVTDEFAFVTEGGDEVVAADSAQYSHDEGG
jgi:hypothetical protein